MFETTKRLGLKVRLLIFLVIELLGLFSFCLNNTFGQVPAAVIVLISSLICVYVIKDENKKVCETIAVIIIAVATSLLYNEEFEFNMIAAILSLLTVGAGGYLFIKSL